METNTVEPSLTVRASSFPALFDCAYRWEGIHLLKLPNIVGRCAVLGTAIHAGTAAYDQAKLDGAPISIDDAAGVLVEKLTNPDQDFDPSRDDLSPKEAEAAGITLLSKYCVEIAPRYVYKAVEMPTEPMDIDCGGGVIVRIKGTLDRARIREDSSGAIGIADLKSGSAAVQKGVAVTKGHGPQIGTYELLYQHSTGVIPTAPAEIIGLKTKGTLEIGTGQITNARTVMVGTETQPGLIQFAADMLRTGRFYPNPKSLLCSAAYCPRHATCQFHE